MSKLAKIKSSLEKPYEVLNRIELSQSALSHNVKVLKDIAETEIIPVLKANAYGHGLEEIAEMLNGESIPYLAVDGYFEALKINDVTKHEVLVLGGIDPANFAGIKLDGFTFVVFNSRSIEALGRLGKPVKVNLEVDTGMRRHGLRPEELADRLELLRQNPNVELTGVMSHLADADNPDSEDYNKTQVEAFDAAVEQIRAAGFDPQWLHLAQSAGSTRVKSKYANASRPGIALYGINPLETSDTNYKKLQQTRPVLSFISRPSALQQLKKGDKVSYGLTFEAPQDMTIAVLPVGYYELLPWKTSGKLKFRLNDQELPQVGRICMNHSMVDVSGIDISSQSNFEIISANRGAANSIQSICDQNDLFNYEFVVNINESTRRIIVA